MVISFVSAELPPKIQSGLDDLLTVRRELSSLSERVSATVPGVIEIAAACAMLHSFYTEIEKILVLIAKDYDGMLPSSPSWHRDLLHQMEIPTSKRPAVISPALSKLLNEFLAFRHLFRGASIALMRWDRLTPLLERADSVHCDVISQLNIFQEFLARPHNTQ